MEYSGGGDPERSIELLWGLREPPGRGPKPRLTVAKITRSAIELADTEGLTALSMRRVAERLGVSTMSLYTYVPGKAELIDLMLDTVYGETARPDDPPASWRAGSSRSPGRTGRSTSATRGCCRSRPAARRSARTPRTSTSTSSR